LLQAGFHRICISPPVGAPLAGFAARQGVSVGIHDDLFVRALVLENESTSLAFVTVDVLALSREFVESVRANVFQRTGIGPDSVMIASTHTHAGPVTISTFFNPEETVDANYMQSLCEAITECIGVAWRKRFPARVGVGAGQVQGIGVNRRSPDKLPIDEEIGVLKVEDGQGRVQAVLVNYACHPTVLGPDNLLCSGDFPAVALAQIERAIQPGGLAMFVNGTEGDISMGHSSELSAIGVIAPGRTFERARELGELLASAASKVLPDVKAEAMATMGAVRMSVTLPLKKYPPLEEAAESLRRAEEHLESCSRGGALTEQLKLAKTACLYASITRFYAAETAVLAGAGLPIELQGFRVNEDVFVAIPAEVFVEVGLRLKRQAPKRTFIAGIANGYIGYLPSRPAYAVGGYEVVASKCAPEAEDVLVEKVIELERKLCQASLARL